MVRAVIAVSILAAASAAWSGGNPDVRIYIDFDPPNYVHECTPEPYQTFNAYVCLDQLDSGMIAVSFRLNDVMVDCPGVFAPPQWVPLLPS
jgi:hypothetical protein